jgi:hypothetical protein
VKQKYVKAKPALAYALISLLTAALFSQTAGALPADFTGQYQILQSRLLRLTNGRGFVLQDGNLVADAAIDFSRTYCRAGQSTFDESSGAIVVAFQNGTKDSEYARLTTIPGSPAAGPTTIECFATNGFTGSLDLAIALGRVMEIIR